MPGRNCGYRGPEIMIKLMRTTNYEWQIKSMRRGVLVSNAMWRERCQPTLVTKDLMSIFAPFSADTDLNFRNKTERELRNLHSSCSRMSSGDICTPHSKYVSLTSSLEQTGWGEGSNPSITFRFDIWRSDVWKGRHELHRDPLIFNSVMIEKALLAVSRPVEYEKMKTEEIPPDWDQGVEFEWLALGGTRIHNVEERQGQAWIPSQNAGSIDFWWEVFLPEPVKQ